jgi:hypothetical protein
MKNGWMSSNWFHGLTALILTDPRITPPWTLRESCLPGPAGAKPNGELLHR